MSLGDVLLPNPTLVQAQPNRLDARSACARSLAAYLLGLTFTRWGSEAADTPFQLKDVREEWPEPDVAMLYPSASIVDSTAIPQGAHSFVPTPLEETWHVFGQDTVLWKISEFSVDFQVDFWADDAPTREAISARLPSAFAPGEDRASVVVCSDCLYFKRPVRMTLISRQRMDVADAVYPRERRLMTIIRCEVDDVDLRCGSILAPTVNIVAVGEDVDPGEPPAQLDPPTC